MGRIQCSHEFFVKRLISKTKTKNKKKQEKKERKKGLIFMKQHGMLKHDVKATDNTRAIRCR